jgi:hypothetical protein
MAACRRRLPLLQLAVVLVQMNACRFLLRVPTQVLAQTSVDSLGLMRIVRHSLSKRV